MGSEAQPITIVNAGYRSTNYWVVSAGTSRLLVDIGWPGTLGTSKASLKRMGVPLREIRYALATHYHIDHAGLAEELKWDGVPLLVLDIQVGAIPHMKTWTKPGDAYVSKGMTERRWWVSPEQEGIIDRTMKAVRIHDYGGPAVLRYEDAPVPEPGPREVLVRVHAAGVNPADRQIRAGLRFRLEKPFAFIPGCEVSGSSPACGTAIEDHCESVLPLSEESKALSRSEDPGYERFVRYVREYAHENTERALAQLDRVVEGYHELPYSDQAEDGGPETA